MKAEVKRWIPIGMIVVGFVILAVWGIQVFRTLNSLRLQASTAQSLLEGNPLAADPDELGVLLHTVRDDVLSLKRNVGWLTPVGKAFRWVPKIGPLLADAREWLVVADGLTEAGVVLWDAIAPSVASFQQGEEAMVVLEDAVARMTPHVSAVQPAITRANAAYARIDVSALPEELENIAGQFKLALPLLEAGLDWVPLAPELVGLETPRTYLMLVLNEDELRPGGGFLTGVGEVHVRAGRVMTMTFTDSYKADDFSQPYPLTPDPLRQFMALELWVFRDSNWSPDFPTSAQQAIALYRPDYPISVDGIVAVDQYATKALIDVLGPLSLPGNDTPVTGESLLEYVYHAWEPEAGDINAPGWWAQRKAFMGQLAEAALSRVENGKVDPLAVVETGMRLLDERHLAIYLNDPQAATLLAEQTWDGGLRRCGGDFMMPVEANVGYNKASAKLDRAFNYEVDLASPSPLVTTTLVYTHTSAVDIACKYESRYDPVYMQMMDRCYWGYIRLYVPEGAELVDASHHPIPGYQLASREAWDGRVREMSASEGPFTVFSQALLVPTKASRALSFTYTLPNGVLVQESENVWRYRLLMQKQMGLRAIPVRVVLHLPQSAVLLSAQPEPASEVGGLLLYKFDMTTDLEFEVRYRLPRERRK